MHVRFNPSEIRYDSYFNQIGGSVGSGDIKYFEGSPVYFQRGHGYYAGYRLPLQTGTGFGDVFRKFWRFLKPVARSLQPIVASAGKAIGEEGLATTARVLNDVVQGTDIKDALANEGREGISNLLGRAQRKLQKGSGATGKGGIKQQRRSRGTESVIFKPNPFVGKSVLKKSAFPAPLTRKRKRVDAFGPY